MGDRRTLQKPLGTGRGLVCWLSPTGGGADVRVKEEGRERKGPSDRRTPGSDRDLGVGRESQIGINQTRYGSQRLARGNMWGLPEREGSTETRWEPAGGCGIHVDGCSAPGWFGGGEAGAKREQSGVEGLNIGEQ